MQKRLDLSDVSRNEQASILQVIQRDMELRKVEDKRIETLSSTNTMKALKSDPTKCHICESAFLWLFNPKVQCCICENFYCKNNDSCGSTRILYKSTPCCTYCRQQKEVEMMSLNWFHSEFQNRFYRHGSAKILREFYKKRRKDLNCSSELEVVSENPGRNFTDYQETNSLQDESDEEEEEEIENLPSHETSSELEKVINNLLLPKLEEIKTVQSQRSSKKKIKVNQQMDDLLENLLRHAIHKQSTPSNGELNSTVSSFRDAETMTEFSDSDFDSIPSCAGSLRSRSSYRVPLSERMRNLSPESFRNVLNAQQIGMDEQGTSQAFDTKEEMVARAEVNAAMSQLFGLSGDMNTVKTNPLQEFSTELKFKGFDSESESESSSSSSSSQDEDLKVEVKTLETTETLNLKMIGDSDFYSKIKDREDDSSISSRSSRSDSYTRDASIENTKKISDKHEHSTTSESNTKLKDWKSMCGQDVDFVICKHDEEDEKYQEKISHSFSQNLSLQNKTSKEVYADKMVDSIFKIELTQSSANDDSFEDCDDSSSVSSGSNKTDEDELQITEQDLVNVPFGNKDPIQVYADKINDSDQIKDQTQDEISILYKDSKTATDSVINETVSISSNNSSFECEKIKTASNNSVKETSSIEINKNWELDSGSSTRKSGKLDSVNSLSSSLPKFQTVERTDSIGFLPEHHFSEKFVSQNLNETDKTEEPSFNVKPVTSDNTALTISSASSSSLASSSKSSINSETSTTGKRRQSKPPKYKMQPLKRRSEMDEIDKKSIDEVMRDLKSAGMTVDKSKFRKSMQPAVSTKKSIFSVETSTTSNKSPDSKPVTMKSPDGNVEEKSLKENSDAVVSHQHIITCDSTTDTPTFEQRKSVFMKSDQNVLSKSYKRTNANNPTPYQDRLLNSFGRKPKLQQSKINSSSNQPITARHRRKSSSDSSSSSDFSFILKMKSDSSDANSSPTSHLFSNDQTETPDFSCDVEEKNSGSLSENFKVIKETDTTTKNCLDMTKSGMVPTIKQKSSNIKHLNINDDLTSNKSSSSSSSSSSDSDDSDDDCDANKRSYLKSEKNESTKSKENNQQLFEDNSTTFSKSHKEKILANFLKNESPKPKQSLEDSAFFQGFIDIHKTGTIDTCKRMDVSGDESVVMSEILPVKQTITESKSNYIEPQIKENKIDVLEDEQPTTVSEEINRRRFEIQSTSTVPTLDKKEKNLSNSERLPLSKDDPSKKIKPRAETKSPTRKKAKTKKSKTSAVQRNPYVVEI